MRVSNSHHHEMMTI